MVEQFPQLRFQLKAHLKIAQVAAAQAGRVFSQHLQGAQTLCIQVFSLVHFGKGAAAKHALDAVFIEENVAGGVGHGSVLLVDTFPFFYLAPRRGEISLHRKVV